MGTLLSLRIQERFGQLTPSEQKLAAVLIDRSDDLLTFSATELARFSGVSKATAARFFRNLGYRDFNEVRVQARQERNLTGPIHHVLAPHDQPRGATTISGHLQLEVSSLTRTFELLRSDLVSDLAEHLISGRRLWIAGLGHDGWARRLAHSLFTQLRRAVQMLPEDSELWPEELASMGPGDTLLAIVSRPWPRALSPLLEFAHTARVKSIAITDPTSQARAQRHGAVPVICHTIQYGARTSSTAFASVISLLHLACVDNLGTRATVRSDLIEELKEQVLG